MELQKTMERRNDGDTLLLLLSVFSIVSVTIVTLSIILIIQAETNTFTGVDTQGQIRVTWENYTTRYLFSLLVLGAVVSVAGLFVNAKRLKREFDYVRVNLIVLLLFSIVGMILYFVR
jgi:cytochrome bd-type quinol oxidase subunit 2